MRFFTRGWASGDLSDEEYEAVPPRYWAHFEAIAATLPPPMLALAKDVDLTDAVIELVRWAPQTRELSITFVTARGFAAPRKPQTVSLTYLGAELGQQRLRTIQNVARDREAQVLYWEVDRVQDGILIHRILFWPRDELTITFRELLLNVSDRETHLVRLSPSYQEVHDDDDE